MGGCVSGDAGDLVAVVVVAVFGGGVVEFQFPELS